MKNKHNEPFWQDLLGKKIIAYRGYKNTRSFSGPKISLNYILFDDEETYLELQDQNLYDYHDCAASARIIYLFRNSRVWKTLMDKEGVEEFIGNINDPF